MEEFMGWFMKNSGAIFSAVMSFVGGFAIIATMTPNKTDNKVMQFIMNLINVLGANFGKAKNAE